MSPRAEDPEREGNSPANPPEEASGLSGPSVTGRAGGPGGGAPVEIPGKLAAGEPSKLPPEWLPELLACPACRSAVTREPSGPGILCTGCRLVYPVVDGIPVMVVAEATPAKPGH
jgi:uncharacterized protein YbaR (Trm112 family)